MIKRAPALSGKLTSRAVEIQRLLRRWRKYIVHAKMLLLIFYEEHPEITLATNYLGTSCNTPATPSFNQKEKMEPCPIAEH